MGHARIHFFGQRAVLTPECAHRRNIGFGEDIVNRAMPIEHRQLQRSELCISVNGARRQPA